MPAIETTFLILYPELWRRRRGELVPSYPSVCLNIFLLPWYFKLLACNLFLHAATPSQQCMIFHCFFFLFCFWILKSSQHQLRSCQASHFIYPQYFLSCLDSDLLSLLPILSAQTFPNNSLLFFLGQLKGEKGHRKYFIINFKRSCVALLGFTFQPLHLQSDRLQLWYGACYLIWHKLYDISRIQTTKLI